MATPNRLANANGKRLAGGAGEFERFLHLFTRGSRNGHSDDNALG